MEEPAVQWAREQRRRHERDAAEPGHRLDPESQAWLERLHPGSSERDAGIAALHALLLKAARFEVNRRAGAPSNARDDDRDELARQSADDALVAVLAKLGDFHGASRFTTWAYKFALLEAASRVRLRRWHGREIDLETNELPAAAKEALERDLTRHQREVLVAVTLNEVPIDVLAERLTTTRGALYETIRDARRRLRFALTRRPINT